MDGLFFDWRTWGCIRTRPKILDKFGARPVKRGPGLHNVPHNVPPLVKKLSIDAKLAAAKANVKLAGAQDKLAEHFNPEDPPKMEFIPDPGKPKATKAAPLKYHTQQMWAAALLVLAVLTLGYTRGLTRASEYGGTYGGTDVPHSTLLVTEDGQATLLATALLLGAILLAPIVLTTPIGSRVALVLTAAMPTAFVWLLPVAAKFEFANSITMLNSHDEADIVGVITTPQATGWMVALFSLPLVALLRIAEVGGRGPQYSSRLRTTGVTTVVLFYVWLVFGAWMRAPVTLTIEPTTTQQKPRALPRLASPSLSPRQVRYSFPAHGETAEENTEFLRTVGRPIPPGAEFTLSPPYATFTFPFRCRLPHSVISTHLPPSPALCALQQLTASALTPARTGIPSTPSLATWISLSSP